MLSDSEKDAAIERLYDVALDPERYEALLDVWEASVRPLRVNAGFGGGRLLDDPAMLAHFQRASQFLDRISDASPSDELQAALSGFGRIPAVVMDGAFRVLAANGASRTLFDLPPEATLDDLSVLEDDRDAVREAIRCLTRAMPQPAAVLRVRSRTRGNFIVIRLEQARIAHEDPLVVAAIGETGWPAHGDDLLKNAFGLTPAEAQVVQGLVECCSVAEIADSRGRSIDTIRAQVKSILSKTGTRSQVELLRLVMSVMDMAELEDEDGGGPRLVSVGSSTLAPRPFQTITTSAGRRQDYLVLGDPEGVPMLFLPLDYGLIRWPASAEADAARRGWRVIVPLRGGYGLSDMIPEDCDYDRESIQGILQILQAEDVTKCPILSLGSDTFYAFHLARAAPERFTAILACAGILPITRPEQYERMDKWHRFINAGARYTPHLLPFMVKAGFLLARRIGKRGFVHAVYGNSQADIDTFEDPEVFEAMVTGSEVALSADYSAHAAFSRMLLGGQNTDWTDTVQAVRGTLPVMFLNGAQDPEVPVATYEEYRADHPWIDFTMCDDAGQLIFFRYWRRALEKLAPFMEQ